MDKWGRKKAIAYAATLSIIGSAIVTASQNVTMFIVFRFVAGAGCGLIQVCE
jgi:MFS family permease